MAEAALLTLDLVLITYCCWVVIRASRKSHVTGADLGLFAYKEKQEESKQ